MIKAISFDLWDTVIRDDSDEPKRAARGQRCKRDERRFVLWEALDRVKPLPLDRVALAFDVADAAFNQVWHDQHVTWTVTERVGVILDGLRRELPQDALAAVVRVLEEMEVVIAPDPVPGVAEALAELAQRFALGVVSDAIVSPGRCLRQWLELHDLKQHFSGFAFSDEVGHSKPHRAMYDAVSEQLGVELHEMIHIGDRDHNDVKGPQALGMKAILFTGSRDRDKGHTSADAICERYEDLPAIVDQLVGIARSEREAG